MLEELRRDLPRAQGPVRHGCQQAASPHSGDKNGLQTLDIDVYTRRAREHLANAGIIYLSEEGEVDIYGSAAPSEDVGGLLAPAHDRRPGRAPSTV